MTKMYKELPIGVVISRVNTPSKETQEYRNGKFTDVKLSIDNEIEALSVCKNLDTRGYENQRTICFL